MLFPNVSIIIPTYNKLEVHLKPCIDSILKYTKLHDKEIVVVANGCVDGTNEYLKDLSRHVPQLKYIIVREAIGYTKAVNIGILNSCGKNLVFLNNDTILLRQQVDDWIHMLIDPLNDPGVAVTGPLQLKDHNTGYEFIVFFCAATRIDVIDSLGALDEDFTPGGCEDIDFCIRAIKAGYDIQCVPVSRNPQFDTTIYTGEFPIYHVGEGTFNSVPTYKDTFKNNELKIRIKHDIK